jgi:hypothetical protein
LETTTNLKIVLTSHYHRNGSILKLNEKKMRKSLEKEILLIIFHLYSSSLIKAIFITLLLFVLNNK